MNPTFIQLYSFPVLLALMLLATSCSETERISEEPVTGESPYTVTRLTQPVEINSEWDKEPWNSIQAVYLSNYMGEEPDPWPEVHAKLAYDDEAIYGIFHVQDQYVRCVVDEYQGPVSRDSCVEFFFTPGTDISEGYFNLEVNCGGTALFAFQQQRGVGRINIPASVFEDVEIAHSMPEIVDPEITDPVTWTLEFRLPLAILKEYSKVAEPASGVEWKANFYKIASQTSHPHYVTWSFVDNPVPQFHMPEYFGSIRFE